MTELITTKTGSGKLTITDTTIILDAPGGFGSQTMLRTAFIDLDSRLIAPSVFGLGGAMTLVFHGQGNKAIEAKTVKLADAKKIMLLLTGR